MRGGEILEVNDFYVHPFTISSVIVACNFLFPLLLKFDSKFNKKKFLLILGIKQKKKRELL